MELPSARLQKETKYASHNTIMKDNDLWFKNTYVNRHDKPEEENVDQMILHPGRIYSFIYNIKSDDNDLVPVVYFIKYIVDENKIKRLIGININFIPPKIRVKIFDKITRIYSPFIDRAGRIIETGKPKGQPQLTVTFDILSNILKGSGFEFAIRSYAVDRITKKPMIVSYDEWWKLLYLRPKMIRKVNPDKIYSDYLMSAIGKENAKFHQSAKSLVDSNK